MKWRLTYGPLEGFTVARRVYGSPRMLSTLASRMRVARPFAPIGRSSASMSDALHCASRSTLRICTLR